MNKIYKALYTKESSAYHMPSVLLPEELKKETERKEKVLPEDPAELLRKARTEALDILEEAKKKALKLREEAYNEGFNQGEKKGMIFVEKEKEALLAEAVEILAEAGRLRKMLIKSAEPQIVELALQIAQTLLNAKLKTEKKLIVDMVAEVMILLSKEEKVLIKVNPADVKTCRQNKDFFRTFLTEDASIKFLPDEEVPLGSCRAYGQYSLVESFLQERFKLLKDTLTATSLQVFMEDESSEQRDEAEHEERDP